MSDVLVWVLIYLVEDLMAESLIPVILLLSSPPRVHVWSVHGEIKSPWISPRRHMDPHTHCLMMKIMILVDLWMLIETYGLIL